MAERTEAAERAQVLRALRSRNAATRSTAVARLCEMFEPLVKAQARKSYFHLAWDNSEDLEQEARIGVVEACATFVAMAKNRKWNDGAFPTYVVWCVRNAISKHIESVAHPVRLPAWMIRRMPKLRKTVAKLAQENGRESTVDEIATAMKLPVHAIETMLAFHLGPLELPSNITGNDPFFAQDTTQPQDAERQKSYLERNKEKFRHG